MGLLGTHSKSTLSQTRFEMALLSLLFISIYYSFSLINQGQWWLSILFVFSGTCSLYFLTIAPKKKTIYAGHICITLAWFAFLNLNLNEHLTGFNWFGILIICSYLLLSTQRANIINIIGLVILFGIQNFQNGLVVAVISILPLCVLLVFSNLISSQFTYLLSLLKRSEISDSLTGCSNKESFIKEVVKSSKICCRYKINMSLISLKVDLTSEEVAEMGLQIFDQYQVALAQVWSSRLRNTDVLCRYQDGVFLVLLPSTSQDNAIILARDLKTSSEQYEFECNKNIRVLAKTITHDGLENWEVWFNRALL